MTENVTSAAPHEEPLIELRDVYKIYGEGLESEVRALDGVNLRIMRGEYVAIIGSSGSGKSTMMNILGCLDQPTYGDYLLDGELVSELNDSELSQIRNRRIGFIFQGFNLIPELTAIENVMLPLDYQGFVAGKRERAEAALAKVGMSGRLHHHSNEMSGGQQQRVAIARAIVTDPPLILADEPTGNLDSHTTADVIGILRDLHASGATVVLITHDREIARNADRTVRVFDGRIVHDSSIDGKEDI